MKKIVICILTGVVLVASFQTGMTIARRRVLWNDEIYTQMSSVSQKTYKEMWAGRIQEGNVAPFFYTLQKLLTNAVGYNTPDLWHTQTVYDRLLLRLNAVMFMSLTVALLFGYFARRYSLGMGFYLLFLTASSFMVWSYWAEARPYSLWVFLTACQSLLFLEGVVKGRQAKNALSTRYWMALSLVHVALSLTVVFSLAQVVIVSLLLWIWADRRWSPYVPGCVIPCGLALFYYAHSPRYSFWFNLTPEQLIRDCFSRDRFYILFIYLFWLGVGYGLTKWPRKGRWTVVRPEVLYPQAGPYAALTILMLLAAFTVIVIFKWQETPGEGFPIASRYFIYLTPIGVIATALLSRAVFLALAVNRWVQLLVTSGMGYLLAHRFWKMIAHIQFMLK